LFCNILIVATRLTMILLDPDFRSGCKVIALLTRRIVQSADQRPKAPNGWSSLSKSMPRPWKWCFHPA